MTQFLKLTARQGGPFSSKFNNMDFDIPEDVYDFSKSYVNVYGKIDVVEQDLGENNDGITGVYPMSFTNETGVIRDNLYNIALVRNSSLTTARAGRIEDIRRVDVLRQNLNEYTLSDEEKRGLTFSSTYGRRTQAGLLYGLNTELYGVGDSTSRDVEFPIRLPLSQLLEVGNVRNMPLTQLGQGRLHLELTKENIRLFNLYQTLDNVSFPVNYFTNADDYTAPENPEPVTSLVIRNTITSLEDVPYWVGQKVRIEATQAAEPDPVTIEVYRTIDNIELNTQEQEEGDLVYAMTLNFQTAISDGTHKLSEIKINFVGADTKNSTFTFTKGELVLHRVLDPPIQKVDVFNYRTFTTEEQLVSELKNYRRMFEMEPEAVNVLFMFVRDPERLTSIPSDTEKLLAYRVSQDNVDNTDRDVLMRTPIHHDRLVMTFLNMSKKLNSLSHKGKNLLGEDEETRELEVIAEPLTQTQRMKLVQLSVNTTGNITNVPLFIFKQVQKSIQM